ncbi:MAG: reverse transcriptase family protein [Terriglobales bacterium]
MALISTKAELAGILEVKSGEIDNLIGRLDKFYRVKSEPKRSGGFRTFYVPQGRLRQVQDKILERVLKCADFPEYLHGGIKKKSTYTNVRKHIRKPAVLVLDVKGFFPNVRPDRVTGVFERLGYVDEAARILTRLTTYKHQLPQGPPTSPAISNLCIPRADARLNGLARAQGFDHSRFVDDMTLSGSKRLTKFRRLAGRIIEEEGFAVKQGPKGKLMLQHESQSTTGLGLNFKLNVPRRKRQEILRDTVQSLKAGVPLDPKARGRLGWVNSTNSGAASRLVKAVKLAAKREDESGLDL